MLYTIVRASVFAPQPSVYSHIVVILKGLRTRARPNISAEGLHFHFLLVTVTGKCAGTDCSSSNISAGVVAAIVIIVALVIVAGVAIIVGALCIMKRRRKKRTNEHKNDFHM